jgi:hypothetical protein
MIKPATISLTSEAGRGYWGESLCLLSSQRVKRTRRTGWVQCKIVGKNSIFVDSVGHHVHSYSINLVCESSWLYGLRMLDTKCLFGNWVLARGQRKANTACSRRLLAHGGRRGGWEPKVNMRTGEWKSLQPIWPSNKSKLQHPLLHILSFLPHFGILSCRAPCSKQHWFLFQARCASQEEPWQAFRTDCRRDIVLGQTYTGKSINQLLFCFAWVYSNLCIFLRSYGVPLRPIRSYQVQAPSNRTNITKHNITLHNIIYNNMIEYNRI